MEYTVQDHMYAVKFYESMARAANKQGKPDVASRALKAGFRHKQAIEQIVKSRFDTNK